MFSYEETIRFELDTFISNIADGHIARISGHFPQTASTKVINSLKHLYKIFVEQAKVVDTKTMEECDIHRFIECLLGEELTCDQDMVFKMEEIKNAEQEYLIELMEFYEQQDGMTKRKLNLLSALAWKRGIRAEDRKRYGKFQAFSFGDINAWELLAENYFHFAEHGVDLLRTNIADGTFKVIVKRAKEIVDVFFCEDVMEVDVCDSKCVGLLDMVRC